MQDGTIHLESIQDSTNNLPEEDWSDESSLRRRLLFRRRKVGISAVVLVAVIAVLVAILVTTSLGRKAPTSVSSSSSSSSSNTTLPVNATFDVWLEFERVVGTMNDQQQTSFQNATSVFVETSLNQDDDSDTNQNLKVLLVRQKQVPVATASLHVTMYITALLSTTTTTTFQNSYDWEQQIEDLILQEDDNDDWVYRLQASNEYFEPLVHVTALAVRMDRTTTRHNVVPSPAPTNRTSSSLRSTKSPMVATNTTRTPLWAPTKSPSSLSSRMLCNGQASLCDARLNQVVFATLHNAMASTQDGFVFSASQSQRLEDGVKAGYRGINLDLGLCSGTLTLFHGYCFLGQRDPIQVFTWLDDFLANHANEVLIIPIELVEDNGAVTLQAIYDMLQSSGNDFTRRLYAHDLTQPWPTLREMIEMDQRVVLAVYNGGESCSDTNVDCPPGLHDWFQIAAETRFTFNALSQLQDTSYSCLVTRGTVGKNKLFGVNTFLSIADVNAAPTLNSETFLSNRLATCSQANGDQLPNLVLVDFGSIGDALAVVADMNAKFGQ